MEDKVQELEEVFDEELREFSFIMQNLASDHQGEFLTKHDMDEMSRQTFNILFSMKDHLIKYLKEN